MPLIRVSDEIHEHLKQISQDGESIDATIRRALNFNVASAYRKYTAREELLPMQIYRWVILSAYPFHASQSNGLNFSLSRRELQNHFDNLIGNAQINKAYPADFTYTPNTKAPRMRWKVRFTNGLRQLIKDGVLRASTDGENFLFMEEPRKEFMYVGLHIDRESGEWHFTKMPEHVNLSNWWDLTPLTIDEEIHEPLQPNNEDKGRLEKIWFMYNNTDFSNLLEIWRKSINTPETLQRLLPKYDLWKKSGIKLPVKRD